MKTFVLIIVILTARGAGVDHIDGFTSKDNCIIAGRQLEEFKAYISTTCIEK